MSDNDLGFEPKTVLCEKCGGIVKFRGSGRYECEDCGYVFLDDFGKVREFLEKRGPSNIMEISYATGIEKTVISKLLMDGRLQVTQLHGEGKKCLRCGIPIARGKYCAECEKTIPKTRRTVKDPKNDDSKMRFINIESSDKKKKKP